MDEPVDSFVGGEARRESIAERRSARSESNSHTAVRRAESPPWNSRARACREEGKVVCKVDWRDWSFDSLSLRIGASGRSVARELVKIDSRWVWAAKIVSSGVMGLLLLLLVVGLWEGFLG
jgi:hypothetical protein